MIMPFEELCVICMIVYSSILKVAELFMREMSEKDTRNDDDARGKVNVNIDDGM